MLPWTPPTRIGWVLLSWASTAGLSKLWRWEHPMTKSYSHLPKAHRLAARIDLAFGNAPLLTLLQEAEYLAGGLFDHNPLAITLAFSLGTKRGSWRSSPGWLQVDQISSHLQTSIASYWSTNTVSGASCGVGCVQSSCQGGN